MAYPSTFSIVAYDSKEEAWGIAVASKFPAVGAIVPWARAGAGAVATQAHANLSFGPGGLELLANGVSATDALERLLAEDEAPAKRQVGLVDADGRPATFTGEECSSWAGGRTGDGYAAQGNLLAGRRVLEALADGYCGAQGDLPERLLAGLLAADRAGGDRRGRQSAALYAVKEDAGYGGRSDRWIDIRVDDHADPVPRLTELLALHRLYFGKSPMEDRLRLDGDVLRTLKSLMDNLGYYQGPADGDYDDDTRRALASFFGNENFEERVNLDAGLIDRPVYEFLLDRFGA